MSQDRVISTAKEQCQLMIDQDQNHRSRPMIEMIGEDDHVAGTEKKLPMEKTGMEHR